MKKRVLIVLLLLILACPLLGQSANGIDTRMALLEQTQRQQDQHMENQDRIIERLQDNQSKLVDRINELKNDQAKILGFGLGIGAILGIVQFFEIMARLRVKKA